MPATERIGCCSYKLQPYCTGEQQLGARGAAGRACMHASPISAPVLPPMPPQLSMAVGSPKERKGKHLLSRGLSASYERLRIIV